MTTEGFDTKDRIFFDKPITGEIGEPDTDSTSPQLNPVTDIQGELEPIRTKSMREYRETAGRLVAYAVKPNCSNSDLEEYLSRQSIHGYGLGTIVAPRWCRGPLQFTYHQQWGIILQLNKFPGFSVPYGPYKVMWFEKGVMENSWAEDLIVIHANLDKEMILDIAESQGVNVREARTILKAW